MTPDAQGTLGGDTLGCRDVLQEASDYHDGDLGPGRKLGFERHLEFCPRCQAFYQSFEHTIRRTREAVQLDPPPGLRDALVREVMTRLARRG